MAMAKEIDPKELVKFGLTNYESKCYMSLLGQASLTAIEVAKTAGIPRPKVYETLENLTNKGLCRTFPDRINRYSAVSPSFLKKELDRSLKVIHTEIEQKSQKLNLIKKEGDEILESLLPLFAEGRNRNNPVNYIEIIKNSDLVKERYSKLVNEAQKEILLFSKPPSDSTIEERDGMSENAKNAIKRNVSFRCIFEIMETKALNQGLYNFMKRGVKNGMVYRVIEKLPMKMAIFDAETVFLALEDPVSKCLSLTTQVIEHQALASGLKILFDVIWERAKDYRMLEEMF
jgi:sugar-specific transcriptional regulator TrmB